ncbi:MAG: OmpA family protein [Cyclobacteriaceae bacterium]
MKSFTRSFSLILFSLLSIGIVRGQNLIPNAGFEMGDCPKSFTKNHKKSGIAHWYSPDGGTPDYFHKCSDDDAGTPENWAGYSQPQSGDAYAGIYLAIGKLYKEQLQVRLKNPLIKDSIYHVVFYLRAAINSGYLPTEISVNISREKLQIDQIATYDLRMKRIYLDPNASLRQWEKVAFTFKAIGGEEFFTIGSLANTVLPRLVNEKQWKRESMIKNATYVYLDEFYLGIEKKSIEPLPTPNSEEEKVFFLSDVDFEFNSAELKESALPSLDSIVLLLNNKEALLDIIGKTDSIGTAEYNYQLGLARALSVAQYFNTKGIELSNLNVLSEGEKDPITSNRTEEGRIRNRAVIIRLDSM